MGTNQTLCVAGVKGRHRSVTRQNPWPNQQPPVQYRTAARPAEAALLATASSAFSRLGRQNVSVAAELHLRRLAADDAEALLEFELANRAYFALSISDRGDDFFARFSEHLRATLDLQATGHDVYYLLTKDDGRVLGRFNLRDIADGSAEVGYRMAEEAAGRGIATSALRELCQLAASRHGLRSLRARTTDDNPASARVLAKVGFRPTGRTQIGGRRGSCFSIYLTADRS